MAGRASYEAAGMIALKEETEGIPDDRREQIKERVRLVWPLYIPAAGTLCLTVACIITANQIGTRRAAAMASAYAISEKAFVEYRDKVIEKVGEKQERAVRDEIAQDRTNEDPPSKEIVIVSGDVLCRDEFSGRYFNSNVELLSRAANEINHQVIHDYYASLTDWYNKIGLKNTSFSDDVGWNVDKMMELEFSSTLSEDGRPCLAVGFRVEPIRNFYRIN
jgi:hypothetical protein